MKDRAEIQALWNTAGKIIEIISLYELHKAGELKEVSPLADAKRLKSCIETISKLRPALDKVTRLKKDTSKILGDIKTLQKLIGFYDLVKKDNLSKSEQLKHLKKIFPKRKDHELFCATPREISKPYGNVKGGAVVFGEKKYAEIVYEVKSPKTLYKRFDEGLKSLESRPKGKLSRLSQTSSGYEFSDAEMKYFESEARYLAHAKSLREHAFTMIPFDFSFDWDNHKEFLKAYYAGKDALSKAQSK